MSTSDNFFQMVGFISFDVLRHNDEVATVEVPADRIIAIYDASETDGEHILVVDNGVPGGYIYRLADPATN